MILLSSDAVAFRHVPVFRKLHLLRMALGSTVYKAELSVADIGRGYYAEHVLALARHPSETEERLMVRLLAFALHAHTDLRFGRGISAEDEPDLWQKDATGVIDLWIDVGLPDERSVRKALRPRPSRCGAGLWGPKARHVVPTRTPSRWRATVISKSSPSRRRRHRNSVRWRSDRCDCPALSRKEVRGSGQDSAGCSVEPKHLQRAKD